MASFSAHQHLQVPVAVDTSDNHYTSECTSTHIYDAVSEGSNFVTTPDDEYVHVPSAPLGNREGNTSGNELGHLSGNDQREHHQYMNVEDVEERTSNNEYVHIPDELDSHHECYLVPNEEGVSTPADKTNSTSEQFSTYDKLASK